MFLVCSPKECCREKWSLKLSLRGNEWKVKVVDMTLMKSKVMVVIIVPKKVYSVAESIVIIGSFILQGCLLSFAVIAVADLAPWLFVGF